MANHQLGDRVMGIGAGPIGQMSIRWARAAGASVIVAVSTAEKRLALATAGGATAVVARPIDEAREAILAVNDGRLPDTVIDTTGNAAVFPPRSASSRTGASWCCWATRDNPRNNDPAST